MLNIKRSVERVENVRKVRFDLDTGVAEVIFKAHKKAKVEALWRAIKESGFTPVKIESHGQTYEGPK